MSPVFFLPAAVFQLLRKQHLRESQPGLMCKSKPIKKKKELETSDQSPIFQWSFVQI